MSSLTPKQKQVLDYVREHIGRHGRAPTLEQIGTRLRLRSLATIHKHLTTLRDKGFITRKWNTPHGISLTSQAEEGTSRLVPVTGDIAPDGALCENASGPSTIDVPQTLAESEECFALRIGGNPIPGSGLQEGDFLIAREASEEDGHELVIAEADGTIRLSKRATSAERNSAEYNESPKRDTVRAVVTGMLRTYGPTEA